jgi:hypothetical protein
LWWLGLPELAWLVVAGRLLDDDVHAVEGVDDSDERHQRPELVLVVVLGGIRPGLVADTTGRVGDAGACSASSRAARSASVKTGASRQAATRLRRNADSPAATASLVCMSVQKPQPLIWLARSLTSSCVAAGSVESETTLFAEVAYFMTLAATGLSKTFKRASMEYSLHLLAVTGESETLRATGSAGGVAP